MIQRLWKKPNSSSGWRTHHPPLLETFAAVNRTALRRLEGDRGILPALRTGRLGFASLKPVTLARIIRAFCFAGLAPLGLVLKALVGEEHLFAGGEDNFRIAFRAL